MRRRARPSATSRTRAADVQVGPRDIRDALLAIGPATWSEMIRYVSPPRGRASRLMRQVVEGLIGSGEVVRSRQGIYSLVAGGEDVSGTVVEASSGLGLEMDEGGRLALDATHGVRPGDRVAAVAAGAKADAVRVLAPSCEPLIGQLRRVGRRSFVESLDRHRKGRIDLLDHPASAQEGDIVEVEERAVSGGTMRGLVTRVVHAGNEAARAAEALLAAHRIPCTWSFDAERLRVPESVTATDRCGRRDLRALPLVTIDGDDARDFDDAVFAQPRSRGGWRLVVAIADVAHYVESGSALDQDARRRGNSVYLPDRVVPMLPETLSNGICSLVPNADRLAVVCDMRVSARGRVSRYEFYDAVIRSHARLTYAGVDAHLRGQTLDVGDEVNASLHSLYSVYKVFRDRRDDRGALDFEAREAVVVLVDGQPTRVEAALRNDAQRLIEEAMIAANVAAARCLETRRAAAKRAGRVVPPPVYRVHEPPAPDRVEGLATALRLAGERLPKGTLTPRTLAEACARARASSSWPRWIWEALVLRALAQARYEPRRLGHFGLALPSYVHFTSPIRRYADLLVHRALKGTEHSLDELDAAAAHISMTERRAEEVERGVDAWLKCTLVADRVGETFTGTVAGVAEFGLFVELDGLFVQGLLHVSNLGRDYYHYLPESMALAADRSGDRFALADRLDVIVNEVSPPTGRIDLVLAGQRRGRRRRVAR